MIMESEMTLAAVMAHNNAQTAYRVSRSQSGVCVTGSNGLRRCELSEGSPRTFVPAMLRDQPLYRITSPSLISTAE